MEPEPKAAQPNRPTPDLIRDGWLPDPDVEGDIPEHLLDYGAPDCFLDDNMSIEGCS